MTSTITEEETEKIRKIRARVDLRRKLGQVDNFCKETSEAIANELGFTTVQGEIYGERDIYAHMWTRSPDGINVDATGDQFQDENIPPVYIFKKDPRYVVI